MAYQQINNVVDAASLTSAIASFLGTNGISTIGITSGLAIPMGGIYGNFGIYSGSVRVTLSTGNDAGQDHDSQPGTCPWTARTDYLVYPLAEVNFFTDGASYFYMHAYSDVGGYILFYLADLPGAVVGGMDRLDYVNSSYWPQRGGGLLRVNGSANAINAYRKSDSGWMTLGSFFTPAGGANLYGEPAELGGNFGLLERLYNTQSETTILQPIALKGEIGNGADAYQWLGDMPDLVVCDMRPLQNGVLFQNGNNEDWVPFPIYRIGPVSDQVNNQGHSSTFGYAFRQ